MRTFIDHQCRLDSQSLKTSSKLFRKGSLNKKTIEIVLLYINVRFLKSIKR